VTAKCYGGGATACRPTTRDCKRLQCRFGGNVIGLNIDGASSKLDLGTLEAIALRITSLKVA